MTSLPHTSRNGVSVTYPPLSDVASILPLVIGALALAACASSPTNSAGSEPGTQLASIQIAEAELIPVEGFSSCTMNTDDFALLRDIEQGRAVPDISSSLRAGRQPLSIQEMNQWSAAGTKIESLPVPLVFDPLDARPVFVAVFDGTWNDRDDKTNPATVPGALSRELEHSQIATHNLQVRYYHGVGTRVPKLRRWWEGATGSGTRDRADKAIADLKAFTRTSSKTPHVYAIGFSRGAASARHFLNLADPILQSSYSDELYDRPRSFALLFDTVATGQTGNLWLGIPPSTIFAIHFVATRERRLSFPVTLALPAKSDAMPGQRVFEAKLPAAHSDLGGGYGVGLEALSLSIARDLLIRQGFVLPEQAVEQQAMLNTGRHISDWPGTATGSLLRQLAGLPVRQTIEPDAVSRPSEDPFISRLEQSMREIAASKAEMERAQARNQTSPIVFDGLSVQLQRRDTELVLTTNCPQHVALDRHSRWLFLDGRPYLQFTEFSIQEAEAGRGPILIIDRQNPKSFKTLSVQ